MTQTRLMQQTAFTPSFWLGTLLLSALLLGVSPALMAQPPVAEGEDLAFIETFEDSSLIRYEQLESASFSFPTAKVKRVDGAWQAETERTVQGKLTSLTYKISERYRVDDVLKFFEAQLTELGTEELYRCKGLSCGNSNKWANIVFNEKRLYGPQTNQRYLVSQYAGGTLSFYLIKRGNKRVYARVDYVKPDTSSASTAPAANKDWALELENSGQLTLGEADSLLATTDSINQLNSLAEWLSQNNQSVYLVVHRYGNLSVAELMEAATKQANNFSSKLQAMGVDEEQINIFAVGPLAPGETGGLNRMTIFTVGTKGLIAQ